MNLLILNIVIFSVVFLAIFISYRMEKRRTERFKAYAETHGFSFSPNGSLDDLSGKFKVFTMGHGNMIKNLMSGRLRGHSMKIFDYQYTRSYGRNSRTVRQTMAMIKLDRAVAEFTLSPESFADKIAEFFGYKDINFESHPDFSKRYLLRSNDPNIKSVFNTAVLDFFEQMPEKYGIYSKESEILVYSSGKRVKPQELDHFVEKASLIADKISPHQGF